MTEDEMVVWHHRLNGYKLEQALGDGEGQGGLACCSLWGHKESDMTEYLNNNIHFKGLKQFNKLSSIKVLLIYSSTVFVVD